MDVYNWLSKTKYFTIYKHCIASNNVRFSNRIRISRISFFLAQEVCGIDKKMPLDSDNS